MSPAADPPPVPDRPAPRPWPVTLRCGVCGRSESFTFEQMLDRVRAGWPVCCGRDMVFCIGVAP